MKVDIVLLGALAAGAAAAPANAVVHEKLNAVNSDYLKRNAVASYTPIWVRIVLKQRNLENGMDFLMKVQVI